MGKNMVVGVKEYLNSVESIIRENGSVRIPVSGTSMLPFLKCGYDEVIISGISTNIERGMVVLYKRVDGSYGLHRVFRCGSEYLVLGDNQISFESISLKQIVGYVTEVYRNGRKRRLACIYYRWVWGRFLWIRKVVKLLRKYIKYWG